MNFYVSVNMIRMNSSVSQTESVCTKMSMSMNVSMSSTVNSSEGESVNITVSEYESECECKLKCSHTYNRGMKIMSEYELNCEFEGLYECEYCCKCKSEYEFVFV